jgi:hypothetical protein
MKKYFAALSTTALICVAPHALAASTADLKVTGTITPIACTPSFSGSGIVDVGKPSKSDLNLTANTLINTTAMVLTMACSEQTVFSLTALDNKASSSLVPSSFGLGTTPANEKLGFFSIDITTSTADGAQAQAVGSLDGSTWTRQDNIRPDRLSSVAAPSDLTTRIEVKDLTMNLDIKTYIARADSLTIDQDVPIDGSATIEVNYM